MTIWIYAEGPTESLALKPFLRRWLSVKLDPNSARKIGLEVVGLDGTKYCDGLVDRLAALRVSNKRVHGMLGLIDFHNPPVPERLTPRRSDPEVYFEELRRLIPQHVKEPLFRQHLAVHETEAWLISQPELFPKGVREKVAKFNAPERVNGNRSPSDQLADIYSTVPGLRGFSKARNVPALFMQLDPEIAAGKCPFLKRFLDDVLDCAQRAL